MSPLPLLVVAAVKVLGVVTSPAKTRGVCNDSNFTIVSVSMDICASINIILQTCFIFINQMKYSISLHIRTFQNKNLEAVFLKLCTLQLRTCFSLMKHRFL